MYQDKSAYMLVLSGGGRLVRWSSGYEWMRNGAIHTLDRVVMMMRGVHWSRVDFSWSPMDL